MNRLTIFLFLAALGAARAEDDRAADREAIRAHIDSIYQAFIHKDLPALRATHDENWRGFLDGSTKMIRGIDQYMRADGSHVLVDPANHLRGAIQKATPVFVVGRAQRREIFVNEGLVDAIDVRADRFAIGSAVVFGASRSQRRQEKKYRQSVHSRVLLRSNCV